MAGKIIVWLVFGLGNRLSGLLSALVLADRLNLEVEVYWQKDPIACNASFAELFEHEAMEGLTFLDDTPLQVEWVLYRELTKAYILQCLSEKKPICTRAFHFFGSEFFGKFEYYELMRAKMRDMRPVKAVWEIMGSVPNAKIGLHARMTDHLPSRVLTPRWCYREAIKLVLARFPNENIYVCSDTPSFVNDLIRSNPQRIFASVRATEMSKIERSSLNALYVALAELWLLSQCELILASPSSSFAALASVFGGGRFVTISAWPSSIGRRLQKSLWPLYRAVFYNLQTHKWQVNRSRGVLFTSVSAAVLMVVNSACSAIFQDLPWPILARNFKKRLNASILQASAERSN